MITIEKSLTTTLDEWCKEFNKKIEKINLKAKWIKQYYLSSNYSIHIIIKENKLFGKTIMILEQESFDYTLFYIYLKENDDIDKIRYLCKIWEKITQGRIRIIR